MNSPISDFSAFPGNCQLNILKNCLKVFLRFDDSFVQLFPEYGVVADDGLETSTKNIWRTTSYLL
jgi:hypothetical protein